MQLDQGQMSASKASSSGSQSQSRSFRAGRDPRPSDVFIAIMGVTGAGKSSFIKTASGSRTIKIGHGLESCTSDVEVHAYDVSPEKTIFLIDTPGFDDTNRTDTEVLRDISTWLGSSYENKVLLHGIIYLHRISDARMQGSAKKNLIMFKKLCGTDALKRVVLVTTMWDKVSEIEGVAREQELLDTTEFWGYMMEKGSVCRRHLNNPQTARDIIQSLATQQSAVTTNIQKELVDEHRSLDTTSAGKELESELLKEREIWEKRLKENEVLWKEALQERDRDAQEAIVEERKRYTKMIQDSERKTESLRETFESLVRQQQEKNEKDIAALTTKLAAQSLAAQTPRPKSNMVSTMAPKALFISDARSILPPKQTPATKSGHEIKFPRYTCALRKSALSVVNQDFFATTIPAKDNVACLKDDIRWDFVAYGRSPDTKAAEVNVLYRSSRRGSDPIEWHASPQLAKAYPKAWNYLTKKGMAGLGCVALGANQKYYMEWTKGGWSVWGSNNFNNALDSARSKSYHKICAVAMGVEDAYFISFGENRLYLGYHMDLGGFYPALATFLDELSIKETPISVTAVSLSLDDASDFILIYHFHGSTRLNLRYNISDPASEKVLLEWWKSPSGW